MFLKILLVITIISHLNANNLALPCAGCHGPKGVSPGETIPSINNLDKQYFINAFKEYKTGERKHYLMQIISRGYSEKEVELLANYYGKKN